MAIRSKSAFNAPEHCPTTSGMPTKILPKSSTTRRRRRRTLLRDRMRTLALAGAAAMIVAGSSGCSMFSNAVKQIKKTEYLDDFMIDHRNKVFAARAWYREVGHHGKHRYPAEFKAGFMEGYQDVANGSNGCLPCTAPSQYWGWKYQSPGGQAAIDAWFSGYPLGVKAAEQDGVGYWSQMRTSMPMTTQTDASALPAPVPAAQPIPQPGEMILGPGGTPVLREGEYVVPGSTRVIESNGEILDVEMLDPPAPVDGGFGEDELLLPDFGDGASVHSAPAEMMVGSSSDSFPTAADAEAMTPSPSAALVPRESAQTYSLNDLGDDAIDGIFGAMEAPTAANASAVSSTSISEERYAPQVGSATLETANANDDAIPFKFE